MLTSQEPTEQAERELADAKGRVEQQHDLVLRLKRMGADSHEAILLLIDLLELQQIREQRLAQARIRRVADNRWRRNFIISNWI